MAPIENAARVAFGLFEVDLQSGEIWKAGFRIRLQELPFKVLAALLAKPGQVVSRAELQMQVWGPDTNVDFERALAVAIKKVREALSDSAENPRFVETLAKRGYRFIAPVTVAVKADTALAVEEVPAPPISSVSHAEIVFGASDEILPPLAREAATGLKAAGTPSSNAPVEQAHFLTKRELALSFLIVSLLALVAVLWMRPRAELLTPARVEQLTHDSPVSAGPPGMEKLLSLAMDGDRVLAPVLVAGAPQLAAIELGTGAVQPLTLPKELSSATIADIARDGSHLLLRSHLSTQSDQPLWIVPTAGGSAMRVGNILAQDATWMPDGNNILFASENELKVVATEGGAAVSYAKLPGRAFWLRWSPDGKLLRFTLMDPLTHTSSLWELAAGDKTAHPLLKSRLNAVSECCGTWTSDGRSYVFQERDNVGGNLWELNGYGRSSALTQLTNGPLIYCSPTAGRASRQIYFYGSDQPMGLQRYDGAELGFRPEQFFLTDANRVTYSRDRKWVAWSDIGGRLWRARAEDGSEKIQLTPNRLDVFLAQWSPDGSRLALMAREPGQTWQIYLVDASGGKLERLLKEAHNLADPDWSADGKRLVYGREPDSMGRESGAHPIEIYSLQNGTTTTLPQSEGFFSPRWSPDGRWIAALTLEQNKVMLFDVSANHWSELASTSASDPVWSSDSKAIYVHAFGAEKQPILRIAVPGGQLQTIANSASFHGGEPTTYFFGGLTPDNAPLIRPGIGTGNLYMLNLDR